MQNVCFAVAHIGAGSYIYERISKQDRCKAQMYSGLGSLLFNYGSLLLLANMKYYLPNSNPVRMIAGAGFMAFLFWAGQDYLNSTKPIEEEVE